MLADIDSVGRDVVRSSVMYVTDEAAVARVFGGVDILLSNASIASSAPVEETMLALWNKNTDTAEAPDRDEIAYHHFALWVEWAKAQGIGLDFFDATISRTSALGDWHRQHANCAVARAAAAA